MKILNNSLIVNIIKLYKVVKLILFIYSDGYSDLVNSLNQSNISVDESVTEDTAEKESKEALSNKDKIKANRRILREKWAEHALGVSAAFLRRNS